MEPARTGLLGTGLPGTGLLGTIVCSNGNAPSGRAGAGPTRTRPARHSERCSDDSRKPRTRKALLTRQMMRAADDPEQQRNFPDGNAGYDPVEVDRRLAELTAAAEPAEQQVAELTRRVEELTTSPAAVCAHLRGRLRSRRAELRDLGARISQMLTLANEEADELRATAATEVRRRLLELDATSARTMADADRYAEQSRAAADRDAARNPRRRQACRGQDHRRGVPGGHRAPGRGRGRSTRPSASRPPRRPATSSRRLPSAGTRSNTTFSSASRSPTAR